MKQLQKSDLKEGEIYKQLDFNYIFLYNKNETSDNFNDGTAISTTHPRYCKRWSANGFEKDMIEATEEEKHWLETCIKANEFVSYEEAMKTFIPEYVECIILDSLIEVGKVYKTTGLKDWGAPYNDGCNKVYTLEIGNDNPYYTSQFKPSTKEAYDAQFVVKEPEFVLPEIWWVRITKENLKDISKFLDFNLGEYNIGLVAGMVKSGITGIVTKGYNSTPTTSYGSTFGNEITYDQFKQYVLKENTTVIEEPKVVLEEPKDKVLTLSSNYGKESIVKVECFEGGVYRIGDKITVFDKYSPNKGKPFTIKSFRWSNDKSKICAVTELHTPNGIGLDKIELYVEPKIKIVEDFVLPENWYIKVTDDNKEVLQQYIRNVHNSTTITLSNINYVAYSKWLKGINRTENKLGYGLISKLNLNPLPNIYRTVTYYNGVEITFEQFKKYVLKDE